MSYYTQLSLTWNDLDHVGGSLDADGVVDVARSFVADQQWSEDLLEDLRNACGSELVGSPGFNGVMSFGVIELIEHISKRLPNITFYAKGVGEASWDVWLREYRAGVAVREKGPFEEYATPIPEELLAQARAAAAAAGVRTPVSKDTQHRRSWLSRLLKR